MLLFRTQQGAVLEHDGRFVLLHEDWDALLTHEPLFDHLLSEFEKRNKDAGLAELVRNAAMAPAVKQEVWAAGVTWLRSREARREESSGAAVFYDLVYDAERPELFFKSSAARVAGHGGDVYIRRDSSWNVPEPELTLFIGPSGKIQGYTIGNDMSSRSIEGENPLYLPQAKIYDNAAALGPCILVQREPISPDTQIHMSISRKDNVMYSDSASLRKMKREHAELAAWLFRECSFPSGCFLMTGTCLVPPPSFTLEAGDTVSISIDGIGTLQNTVAVRR